MTIALTRGGNSIILLLPFEQFAGGNKFKGKRMKKSVLWVLLLTGIFATQLWAQTEASMCVSVTDVCCNAAWDSVTYAIPANKVISKTFIHFNSPTNDEVDLFCLADPDGARDTLWTKLNLCNCGTTSTTVLHPIGSTIILRFFAKCSQCTNDCANGSSTVHFYTSATAGSCPPNCNKD